MRNNLFLLIIIILLLPQLALADEQAEASLIERQSQEIYDTTMSPFCPGRTISACPSPDARNLRDQIQSWFAQGYSVTAVKNQLRTLYGDSVLGVPDSKGFDLVAWLSPLIFIAVGLCLIYMLLYRLKSSKTAKIADVVPDSALIRDLENEVQRRLKE